MKLSLSLTVLLVTVGVLYSAPEEQPSNISEDTLKRELAKFLLVTCLPDCWNRLQYPLWPWPGISGGQWLGRIWYFRFSYCSSFSSELSMNGEKLVDEEVRRALYGVKQMREVMWRNAQKHQQLMASLVHSGEKKKVRAVSGGAEMQKERWAEGNEVCVPWTGGSQTGSGGVWEAGGGRGAVQRIPADRVGRVQALSGGCL